MTAKFYITTIFAMSTKNYLVLGGKIIDGEILKGMQITLSNRKIEIKGIEIINKSNDKTALTGLLIEYRDKNELKEFENLFNKGEEIKIVV